MIDIKLVPKTWGYEKWIVNNELYCGKELVCNINSWSSNGKYHYHKIKDETFYIVEGSLILVIKEEGKDKEIITLKQNDVYRIKPGLKHKFTAFTEVCKFIEFSTQHFNSDSYRVDDKDRYIATKIKKEEIGQWPDSPSYELNCSICNEILNNNDNFCSKCGAEFVK